MLNTLLFKSRSLYTDTNFDFFFHPTFTNTTFYIPWMTRVSHEAVTKDTKNPCLLFYQSPLSIWKRLRHTQPILDTKCRKYTEETHSLWICSAWATAAVAVARSSSERARTRSLPGPAQLGQNNHKCLQRDTIWLTYHTSGLSLWNTIFSSSSRVFFFFLFKIQCCQC